MGTMKPRTYNPCPEDLRDVRLNALGRAVAELAAEAFHESWRQSRIKEGKTVADLPELLPWDKLSDEQRVASRSQAVEAVKLIQKTFGKILLDKGEADKVPDLIAENAHEVWAADKMAAGWKYGPQRDNGNKIHPLLVPYGSLPESEKEYDRMVGRVCKDIIRGSVSRIINKVQEMSDKNRLQKKNGIKIN